MLNQRAVFFITVLFFSFSAFAQNYPQNYFRSPLAIPLQLVANFGEIRANHWHMGLDIRTQQRVNLPVYAAAEGYVARVVVEPGGFGQAIYINHPNGYTTLYAHMNAFYPALAQWVKDQQHAVQSWAVNLQIPAGKFPLAKGDYIGLSGNAGASAGPHVHFEIRDIKTENCLNPLLFNFPIADAVPPTVTRLALYDRNKSTYMQPPQLLPLKRAGGYLTPTVSSLIRVGSNKISFALSAADRFSGSNNFNGIYSAELLMDGKPVTGFIHDNISYDDTRYINAQIDLPFAARTGINLQHLSPVPGVKVSYETYGGDGLIYLKDNEPHEILIEVQDANHNKTRVQFTVQYDASLAKPYMSTPDQKFAPNNVNVYESESLEVFTSEYSLYDTIPVVHTINNNPAANAVSAQHTFLSASIPAHDSVSFRIKPTMPLSEEDKARIVIKNTAGNRTFYQKAHWQKGWLAAKFRQFGAFQAFLDKEPPTINSPLPDLSKASRIVFTPKDNFGVVKNFRAELDGKWLLFTNDKGKTWIYSFDEAFPPGEHQLKVRVEDEAGNVTEKTWAVRR